METSDDGSKESPEKDKESEDRRQSGTTSKFSRPSDAGTRVSSLDSVPSLTNHPVPQNSPESQLEGENHKEPEGLTSKQYKYDATLQDHEELSKNLRESAMRTMIKMLELQAARRTNSQRTSSSNTSKQQLQPSNEAAGPSKNQLSTDSGSAKDFETRLQDMEAQVKQASIRISESKREQAYLMSLINNLEVKMYRTEEAEYIKDILSKVPSESDLERMKRLQLVMTERKRLERETQRLQMEIRAMNNAMANADVIVSESSPIKKPRRVVIRETPDVTDDPSAQICVTADYCPGRPERRGHISSPEPPQESSEAPGLAQDDEEGRKRSVESEDEVEVIQSEVINEDNESEVKATPTKKGKKSKKK
ncbi:hypothetical protein GE061_005912 [Apolygus lucorum]|uniref:Uncharacterized protein n=1 Tax=Apolygus lucorum TaxID=248454 RepID=A0A8S9WTR6_APOLU|nr:hypothetical protein GE061_005912 [Apolygus lucorum]